MRPVVEGAEQLQRRIEGFLASNVWIACFESVPTVVFMVEERDEREFAC